MLEVLAVPLLDSAACSWWWGLCCESPAFVQAASVNELPAGVCGTAGGGPCRGGRFASH